MMSVPAPSNAQNAPKPRVAALYVQEGGCYYGLDDVDPWPSSRDARLYAGPWPVVAHPPCARWCQMAPVNQARYGIPIGDDHGCFSAALAAVRCFGGVLEHPAVSLAWPAFGLPRPQGRAWVRSLWDGGWVAEIEQSLYGHAATKKTWLYAYGVDPPPLKRGRAPTPTAWISSDRPRAELAALGIAQLQRKEASATPIEFRDLLLSIARSARDGSGTQPGLSQSNRSEIRD